MTSGASAAATVPRLSRMSPKFLVTTLMVAPFLAAQSFATLVTAAARSESVQITMLTALCAAVAVVATTAASAATAPISAHVRLSEFCINALPCLGGTTRHGPAGGRHQPRIVDRKDQIRGKFLVRIRHFRRVAAPRTQLRSSDGGDPDDRAPDGHPRPPLAGSPRAARGQRRRAARAY